MSNSIRCRFAPSPTGHLHLGGARTALFNYLFAKQRNGTFILRIEDTDLERSSKEAEDAIFGGLEWLGLTWDEGPFFQSKRNDLYGEYVKKLLSTGMAYPCTCTPEELEKQREEQKAKGENPRYMNTNRPKQIAPLSQELPSKSAEVPFVIRLRTPEEGSTVFNDLILGDIETPNQEIDDFVIMRSDGSPTYNFVVVVDDIDMEISHVIRGNDHVSNTPKQIAVYEALGKTPPQFAHVPMILGPDKKKLSKRHGATSVFEYRHDGYLPDAFLNYLARLGWSHGDQEIFSKEELGRLFSLDHVGKSPSVFDFEKLSWVSAEHIKTASFDDIIHHLTPFLSQWNVSESELLKDIKMPKLIDSFRERAKTLKDIAKGCEFYFTKEKDLAMDPKAEADHLTIVVKEPFIMLIDALAALTTYTESEIENAIKSVIEKTQMKLGKLAQPVRVAVTGSTVSPPIYAVLEILGKERSIERLNNAVSIIDRKIK